MVLSKLNNIILNCLEEEALSQFFSLLLQKEEELKYDSRILARNYKAAILFSKSLVFATLIIKKTPKRLWSFYRKFFIHKLSRQNDTDFYCVRLGYFKKENYIHSS